MRQAALLGMPNCGKSSIFRLLTGKQVPTGNRAGVTVEAASAPVNGVFERGESLILTDLPGIRSAQPSSEDEQVTLQYLQSHTPDLLIVVLDATDFARQFKVMRELLSHASAETLAVVMNFCDELAQFPREETLSGMLGVPVFPLSARTGQGLLPLREFLSTSVSQSPGCECTGCQRPCRTQRTVQRWNDSVMESVGQALGGASPRRERLTRAIDRRLLSPALGFPLFCVLMALILFAVFGAPGEWLCSGFERLCLMPLTGLAEHLTRNAPPWVSSLLCDGIIGGIGAVFSFLPRLLLLFFFQSVLEQSGFLARMTRLFDPLMNQFGLRGDAVTPLLLGFGCSVPALLCTRGMKDATARKRCACFLPAVACSARMPLCLLISDCFFPGAGWAVCAGVWVFSGGCFLLFCAISARLAHSKGLPQQHLDPLPRWRIPAWQELFGAVCEELLHFLSKAGGLIFLSSVLIWLLSGFCPGVAGIVPAEKSLLAGIGKAIAPLFAPLGLADWRIVAALLAGIGAKEASLSTLAVLFGGASLPETLTASGALTPASAIALLVFYTLYFPCCATFSTMRRAERRALWVFPVVAYLLSLVAYRIALLFLF